VLAHTYTLILHFTFPLARARAKGELRSAFTTIG
jgi:hypothetical protein